MGPLFNSISADAFNKDLLMHQKFSWCISDRKKLKNMKKEPNNTHIPTLVLNQAFTMAPPLG